MPEDTRHPPDTWGVENSTLYPDVLPCGDPECHLCLNAHDGPSLAERDERETIPAHLLFRLRYRATQSRNSFLGANRLDTCFEDRFPRCPNCQERHPSERDLYSFHNEHQVPNCTLDSAYCWPCNCYHAPPQHICCRRCGECSHATHDCGQEWCDHCGEYEPYPSCSNGGDQLSTPIHRYSYTPMLIFRGEPPTYLGWELEVECGRASISTQDAANLAQELVGGDDRGNLVYLKEDGSISNGWEMVTHPMSYQWAMENFPWNVLTELRRNGCHTTANNGLHVHVSRSGFRSQAHIMRWLLLFYRNSEYMSRLARRSHTHWAAFNSRDQRNFVWYAKGLPHVATHLLPEPDFREFRRRHYGDDRLYPERYSAINVTPRDTFEVRFFRATLNPRKARAALALVQASVEYTRNLSASTQEAQETALSFGAFTQYVHDNESVYPDLVKEMEERL